MGRAAAEAGDSEAAPPLPARPQERYHVLYIRPTRIHRRQFDPRGNEIEPNFSATRRVNTGFLMSSYSRYLPPFLPHGPPALWPASVSRGHLAARKSFFSRLASKPMSGLRIFPGLFLCPIHSGSPGSPQPQAPSWPLHLAPSCSLAESSMNLTLSTHCLCAEPRPVSQWPPFSAKILIWFLGPLRFHSFSRFWL